MLKTGDIVYTIFSKGTTGTVSSSPRKIRVGDTFEWVVSVYWHTGSTTKEYNVEYLRLV